MKLNKYITNAFVAVAAIAGFSSCSSDDYEGAAMPDTAQVYFSNENSSEISIEENQNSVQIEVRRIKKEGELTVNVEATEASATPLFTVASSVTFADGEDIAYIPVTFNFSDLTADTDYDLTLKLLSETSAYGDAEKTFTIKYAPWTEWEPYGWEYPSDIEKLTSGKYDAWVEAYTEYADGGYTDDALIVNGELPTYTYAQYMTGTYSQPVFYRESSINPDNAQLKLYDWFYGVELTIDWDKANNEFSIESQGTGYVNTTYSTEVLVTDTYNYFYNLTGDQSITKEDVPCSYDEETGKFTLNVIYYIPYNGSYGYFGCGEEYIQLPGYTQYDYTLGISDEGVFQSGSQLGEVFNFTLGEDLGKIQYAAFEGSLTADEIASKADGIFSGSIESTTTTESGYKVVLVPEAGDYTLVAVRYDNDGNRVDTDEDEEVTSYKFTVTSTAIEYTWTAIYQGDYTYSLFFGSEEEPVVDEGLTLYQCNEDPTKFKIEDWGYGADFTFTMNDDGSIMVDNQATGYEDQTYGMVMVDDLVDYTGGTNNGQSYYADGTFNFAVIYYVSEGYFAYGTETFTLTSEAAQAANKALAAAKVKAKAGKSGMRKANLKARKGLKKNGNIASKKRNAKSPKFANAKALSAKKISR